MNRVLIISDSHGWEGELPDIRKRHTDVEMAIHCGDSELEEDNLCLTGFQIVKGNCDRGGDFPEELILDYGGLRFLIVHGHLLDVKRSLMKLEYRAQEVDADIICFGHSHVAYAENIDGRLFINPGSIRLPRYFNQRSYAMLNWDHSGEVQLDFFNENGEQITNFPYSSQFSLK